MQTTPITVENVVSALSNLRGGKSYKVRNVGSDEIGTDWVGRLSLLTTDGTNGALMLYLPGGRSKRWRLPAKAFERKGAKPASYGISALGLEKIAPNLLRYVEGMREQICPNGYLYSSKVTEIRYMQDWPGIGYQVKLDTENHWIHVDLLKYHVTVTEAVAAAEQHGREHYLADRPS